jgi:hypothetical protein
MSALTNFIASKLHPTMQDRIRAENPTSLETKSELARAIRQTHTHDPMFKCLEEFQLHQVIEEVLRSEAVPKAAYKPKAAVSKAAVSKAAVSKADEKEEVDHKSASQVLPPASAVNSAPVVAPVSTSVVAPVPQAKASAMTSVPQAKASVPQVVTSVVTPAQAKALPPPLPPASVVTSAPVPVVTSAPASVVTSAPASVVTSAPVPVVTSAPTSVVASAPPASAPVVAKCNALPKPVVRVLFVIFALFIAYSIVWGATDMGPIETVEYGWNITTTAGISGWHSMSNVTVSCWEYTADWAATSKPGAGKACITAVLAPVLCLIIYAASLCINSTCSYLHSAWLYIHGWCAKPVATADATATPDGTATPVPSAPPMDTSVPSAPVLQYDNSHIPTPIPSVQQI